MVIQSLLMNKRAVSNPFILVAGMILTFFFQVHVARCQIYTYKYPETNSGLGKIGGKITGDLKSVSDVKVLLLQNDEVIDVKTTDENGNYLFPYLTPGCYDIRAEKACYRTHVITHIPACAERITPADLYLPKFNNANMLSYPIVEVYQYPKRWVKDLMKEDYNIYVNQPLPKEDDVAEDKD
jgi:hypothetical protein